MTDPTQPSGAVPAKRQPPKGVPFTKNDPRRSPGGLSKERKDLRAALEADGPKIHAALMALIEDGNAPAIIYAHTQLVGKPKESVEVTGRAPSPFDGLTTEQLVILATRRAGE